MHVILARSRGYIHIYIHTHMNIYIYIFACKSKYIYIKDSGLPLSFDAALAVESGLAGGGRLRRCTAAARGLGRNGECNTGALILIYTRVPLMGSRRDRSS